MPVKPERPQNLPQKSAESRYFYAPSLAANGTLASYITSKNYKDFGTLTLGKGLGFWVNYAGGVGVGDVTGVAAITGGAISGATVTLKDTSGKSATGTTLSDGSFQINVQGMTPPFLLSVTSNGQTSFGYASQTGGVANLNQYSTAVLQAYYLTKGSSINQTFNGNLNSLNVPTQSQVDVLTKPVVRAIQPYLLSANVLAPQNFNPLSALFTYSSSSGFGQILSNTTISTTGAGFTVASATTTGPTTAFSYTSGASGVAAATPSADFVTIQTVTTTPGSPTTTLTTVKDLCSAHGTLLPGTTGLYDCTSKITISPSPINISAGAYVAMGDFLLTPSNLNPSVEIFDVNGFHASIPPGQTYLKWVSSDSAAIQLSSPSTLYWPTLTALNVGTSLVTLTDTISNVSAQVTVNGIIPILTPSQIVVAPAPPYGSNSMKVRLTDSSGNKVATPAGLTVNTADPAVATASFDSFGDIWVQGVAPSGMTTLNVKGTFGNAGQKTISALVCAQSWAPTTITGTYSATVTTSYTNPPSTAPDSGTFSGTLTAPNMPICGPFGWYISSASLTSALYGNHYSVPGYAASTIKPTDYFGSVLQPSTVGTSATGTTSLGALFDFSIQGAGSVPGVTTGSDWAWCSNVVWVHRTFPG